MTFHLQPCPACARHIRADSPSCPFCAAVPDDAFHARPSPARPPAGLNRRQLASYRALGYATIAAVATVATFAGCENSIQAAYGIAIDGGLLFEDHDASASSSSGFSARAMPSVGASADAGGDGSGPPTLPASCSGQTYFVSTGDPNICGGGEAWFTCEGSTFSEFPSCVDPGPGWSQETTAPDPYASSSSATSTSTTSATSTSEPASTGHHHASSSGDASSHGASSRSIDGGS